MTYIDGFLTPVPRANLDAYRVSATKAGAIFKEYGAIAYFEYQGDEVPVGELTSFPRAVQLKDDEVVMFAWVVYPDKATRDAAGQKIMSDPRMEDPAMMPFDGKRMIYGGFSEFFKT